MWLQLIHRHDLAGWLWAVAVFVAHLLVVARALTRPNRTPASRVAWVAVILSVPALGMVAYLLLGETSIGRTRMQRLRRTEHLLEAPKHDDAAAVDVAPRINALFDLCRSINGFRPVGGNRVALLGHPGAPIDEPKLDCRAALDTLIADIEQARETVTEYIPLTYLDDATAMESGQVVRIDVPRSSLAAFGLPVAQDRLDERVKADIIVGDDGLARAIRFVQ